MSATRPTAMRAAPICAAICLLGGSLALSGCAHRAHPAKDAATPAAGWRKLATAADHDRLRGWRNAWMEALAAVRTAGKGPAIADAGALFDPDRALAGPLPPPGSYRCRIYKLGATGPATPAFRALPAAACRVAVQDGATSLYRLAGVQRPVGRLYADSLNRAVFLGTLVLGDESRPLQHGQDARRDLAGYVERIGPLRWRLVLPYPSFDALLDVVELTPAAAAQ